MSKPTDDDMSTLKRFWWSQKQFDVIVQNAPLYMPPQKPKSQPNEVLVDGEWRRYSSFCDSPPNFDDVELVAELHQPIKIKVEGREMTV